MDMDSLGLAWRQVVRTKAFRWRRAIRFGACLCTILFVEAGATGTPRESPRVRGSLYGVHVSLPKMGFLDGALDDDYRRTLPTDTTATAERQRNCTTPARPWTRRFAVDDAALRSFFVAMDGQAWPSWIRGSWGRFDVSHCCWNVVNPWNSMQTLGAVCGSAPDTGEANVTGLNFINVPELKGQLPDSIADLSSLQVLAIENCNVFGTLPDSLGSLHDLWGLALDRNHITGTVPSALWDLRLRVLFLHVNDLSGSLPRSFGQLCNSVTELSLSTNHFVSNGIPEGVYNCTRLETLSLGDNTRWGGTIASSIGQLLPHLYLLELSMMGLSGTIPAGVWSLKGSTHTHDFGSQIYLSINALSGTIPGRAGETPFLSHLDLSQNELTGSIPESLLNATDLTWLSLDRNHLSGTLSTRVGRLEKLSVLGLSYNQLNGTVPATIYGLEALTRLLLGGNALLTGTLGHSLANLTQLEVLGLFNTSLAGEFPWSALEVSPITGLSLAGTPFSGSVQLQHSRLEHLDISSCHFSGPLPDLPPSMVTFVASNSGLTGTLPSSWGNCTNLDTLMVGGCALAGEVPESFRGMASMRFFSLAGCGISGPFPSWIPEVMPDVEVVSLIGNQFTGLVGAGFAQLDRLKHLDVSMNRKLSGTIPPFSSRSTSLEFFSARGCGVTGKLDGNLSQAPALSTLCIESNLLSCPINWGNDALPASNGSVTSQMSAGACQVGEVGVLSGNSFECEIPTALEPLVNDFASYVCVTSTPLLLWRTIVGTSCFVLTLGLARACGVKSTRIESEHIGVRDHRVSQLLSMVRVHALAAVALSVIGGASAFVNRRVRNAFDCRGEFAISTVGVRYDLALASSVSEIPAVTLAVPAICAAILWISFSLLCVRMRSSSEESPLTSIVPSRSSVNASGSPTSQHGSLAERHRSRCGAHVLRTVVGFVIIIAICLLPNAVYVISQGSAVLSSSVKRGVALGVTVTKAVMHAVIIPLATKRVLTHRHQATSFSQAFWFSLGVRLFNVVLLPVAVVLALDTRCLNGLLRPSIPSNVTSSMTVCKTFISNAPSKCLHYGEMLSSEVVELRWVWDPSCTDAVLQRYGNVIAASLVLQGTLFLSLRMAREFLNKRVRIQLVARLQRASESDSSPSRASRDRDVDTIRLLPLARWTPIRTAYAAVLRPWHSNAASQYSGAVSTLTAGLVFGAVAHPPVAWAAALSLVCQVLAQSWLAAEDDRLAVVKRRALTVVVTHRRHEYSVREAITTTAHGLLVGFVVFCLFHALLFGSGAFAGTVVAAMPPLLPVAGLILWVVILKTGKCCSCRRRTLSASAADTIAFTASQSLLRHSDEHAATSKL